MKKLFLLLAVAGLFITSCESGGIEEENGGSAIIPEITYSPKLLEFDSKGGEQEVVITANFEYDVTENADWLSINRVKNGVKVLADKSEQTSARTANVVISNDKYDIRKIIEVRQGAYAPKIKLSQQTVECEFEPDTYSVDVTSPYSWTAESNNDWLIVESTMGIAGTEKLTFSILRHEEEKERKGTIVLKNTDYNLIAELYVIQKAFVPSITIEPKSLNFVAEGGEQEVVITSNFDYKVSTNADWIEYSRGENSLKISVSGAISSEKRTADIVISNDKYNISEIINISQDGVSDSKKVILYTSSNGKVVTPYSTKVFGANIVSNTYKNGQGIIIFDATVTSIGYQAFNNCSSLTSVTIPNSVTSIGNNAFYDCSSLTSVTIGNSVTEIGWYAFFSCDSLTSITIPDSVTKIGYMTFSGCSSLTSVTIGNSVTSIGHYAFYYCSSLTSVTIPDSVTSIGEYAFCKCSSLTSVYCKPTTPPMGGSSMFSSNASGRKIYVPTASVDAYKSALDWRHYTSDIVAYDFSAAQ